MGEGSNRGMPDAAFTASVVTISGLVVAQSVGHLVVTLGMHRIGTVLDLDRSNSLPDVVSTVVLGTATAGAAMLSHRAPNARRRAAQALVLAVLTLADLLHVGPPRHDP